MKFVSKLSKETLICSELRVREYKDILKCSYGDTPDELLFIETLCEVFSVLTKKPAEHFKKLNIIDFFCLLLDIRNNSQGNVCKVVLTNQDKKMNLDLRLDFIKEDLEQIYGSLFTVIEQDGVEIKFECPSIERMLEDTKEDYYSFITQISYAGVSLDVTTNKQAEIVFNKITPKISIQIVDEFEKLFDRINKINFLKRYKIKDYELTFIPTLEMLIWFTKLIFGESLDVFYDNLFYLSHLGHLGGEYVENSVVGEYNYFVNCLKRTLASKESSENSQQDSIGFSE